MSKREIPLMGEGGPQLFILAVDPVPRKPYPDPGDWVPEIEGLKVVFNKEDATCGGDKPIGECETTKALMEEADEYASNLKPTPSQETEGFGWNTHIRLLGRKCTACARSCEIAVQTNNGTPTGKTRMTFSTPDPNELTIDLRPYENPPLSDEALAEISEVFKKLGSDQSKQ